MLVLENGDIRVNIDEHGEVDFSPGEVIDKMYDLSEAGISDNILGSLAVSLLAVWPDDKELILFDALAEEEGCYDYLIWDRGDYLSTSGANYVVLDERELEDRWEGALDDLACELGYSKMAYFDMEAWKRDARTDGCDFLSPDGVIWEVHTDQIYTIMRG